MTATSDSQDQAGAQQDGGWILAIDIGGTKIGTGLVDANGELYAKEQEPNVHSSAEELYGQVLRMASETRAKSLGPVVAVGIGSGGPSRDMHRYLSPLNIPVWRDFPLVDRLHVDMDLPVFAANDAQALALGEGWRGAAQGVENFIAMVVSTGVGGGIVLRGRLLDGADGNAGHVGHVFVDPNGGVDAGGVSGLLEGSASGTAIAKMTGEHPKEASVEVRRQTGQYVGRAVASVANLLDLKLAVIAGSVALGYGDDFFDACQETVDELAQLIHSKGTQVIQAGLGDKGPLVGAGAVGWRGLGRKIL